MKISSSAFRSGGAIPSRYTCEGDDVSPPLSWTDVPRAAKSLVLVVEDPDAPDPDAPRMTWIHWVLYNLPHDCAGLAESVEALPAGTREGVNGWDRTGYGGPCPPVGRHRYFHRLYALDVLLPDLHGPTRAKLDAAMHGHVIAEAELVGTYRKAD